MHNSPSLAMWTCANLFNFFLMQDCPASGQSGTWRNKKADAGTSPVQECYGTGLRDWMPMPSYENWWHLFMKIRDLRRPEAEFTLCSHIMRDFVYFWFYKLLYIYTVGVRIYVMCSCCESLAPDKMIYKKTAIKMKLTCRYMVELVLGSFSSPLRWANTCMPQKYTLHLILGAMDFFLCNEQK